MRNLIRNTVTIDYLRYCLLRESQATVGTAQEDLARPSQRLFELFDADVLGEQVVPDLRRVREFYHEKWPVADVLAAYDCGAETVPGKPLAYAEFLAGDFVVWNGMDFAVEFLHRRNGRLVWDELEGCERYSSWEAAAEDGGYIITYHDAQAFVAQAGWVEEYDPEKDR